ncbi:MAG TPA: 50S ribosomal protein L11 methyltransferase [Terriglobia bacterium]|nr:50S ribosomal protein L11 methyltransferase [Terriglobia bacterium]
MPYRIDISNLQSNVLDRLVQIGALDVEEVAGGVAAIVPDGVAPEEVCRALGVCDARISTALARDDGSVWLLGPRAVQIGKIRFIPAEAAPTPDSIRLTDSSAFGTGHHPTTAMCIEALQDVITRNDPDRMLDVGTGSGILALASLKLGVSRAVGLEIDADALKCAAENSRLNDLEHRLQLICGRLDHLEGVWPLVVANVLPAPLIEMAPLLVRHVAPAGVMILSGIPSSFEAEVSQPYMRLGMRLAHSETRAGWVMLEMQTSW